MRVVSKGIRGNRTLAALVFLLTLGLSVWGVILARTFLRMPGQADGAVARTTAGAPNNPATGAQNNANPNAPKPLPAPTARAKTDPGVVSAVLQSAAELGGQPSKAEVVLAKGVEASPYSPELRIAHAQILVAMGSFEQAYREYEAALSLDAEAPPGETPDKNRRPGPVGNPKLQFEAGTVANKAGLTDRALEHYSMAQSGDPIEPKYPLYLAMVQLKLGQDDAAMASLVRSVKLDPDLAESWGTLAEIFLKQNKLGLALQHIDRARTLQPGVVRWRLDEARILKRQGNKGDIEKAASILTAMDKSERQKPEVMAVIAECYGMMHRAPDAAAMYAEAAAANPGDGALWYQAALWYEKAGQTDLAVQHARAAATRGNADGRQMLKRLGSR